LVKLIAIARSRLQSRYASDVSDPEVAALDAAEVGKSNLSEAEARRTTSLGLQRVVEACRQSNALPILLTYAASAPPFAAPQLGIREATASTQAPLIDLQARFTAASEQVQDDELLIPNDWHPTPRGAALMADEIAHRLFELKLVDRAPRPMAPVEVE